MRDLARFRPLGLLLLPLLLRCGDSPADSAHTNTGAVVRITPARLELTAGARYGLTVNASEQDGTPIPPDHLQWSTSDPRIAFANADGQVVAQAPGAVIITARFDMASATTSVDVLPGAVTTVTTVTVDPASTSLRVGEQRSMTARATDANGAPVGGLVPTWSTDDPDIATVDQAGTVAGISAGSIQIRAQIGGVVGFATVTVTPAVDDRVAVVRLTPTGVNLDVGGVRQFTATALNAAGGVLSGYQIDWSTQNPSVATVAGDGTVTAVGDGLTHIVATISGVRGTAAVNVISNPPPPGTWPNEPPGFTPVSNQPWDLLTSLGWILQFGTASIGVDLTAPASPPGVLTILYPVGFHGGSAPGTMARDLPTRPRRLFVGTWWKTSDPWQGHSSNVNKVLFLFPQTDGDMTMVMYGSRGGPYELRVLPQFKGIDSDWLRPNVESLPVTLGEWHRIEWLVDNGAGTGVGIVRWWLDGRLLGDYPNVPFPNAGMETFKISPTWGGAGDDLKQETDFFWYDQSYISSAP